MVGVAAVKRTAVVRGIVGKTGRKGAEPCLAEAFRQRHRQQEAERPGAFGGEVRQVHAQGLAADHCGRIVREEVHAGDDAVGGQHKVASGRRRERSRVVDQPERAGAVASGRK